MTPTGRERRLARWLIELLIAVDQLAHVLFGGPKYLIRGGPVPSADETISSKVGRQAMRGRKWALLTERGIDALFTLLGETGHCRNRIEWEELEPALRDELRKLLPPLK